jgi:hypothetical protein
LRAVLKVDLKAVLMVDLWAVELAAALAARREYRMADL